MSNYKFLGKGIEILRKAVQQDNKMEYEEAAQLYVMGIQYLLTASKYEKRPQILKVIHEKAKKYLKRVEEIKKYYLQSEEISKTQHQNTSNTTKHEPITIPTYSISERLIHGFCRFCEERIPSEIIKLCISFYFYVSFDQFIETPNTLFCDIAGVEDIKQILKERIIFPVKYPQLVSRCGSAGIILYGPRGVGKKSLVQAIYNECQQQLTFIHIPTKDIFNTHLYGISPNIWMNKIYQFALQKAPSIVLFDEMSFKLDYEPDPYDYGACYIQCLERMNERTNKSKECKLVFTVAITTDPWNIDPAVRRRCSSRIFVGLPNKSQTRSEIFKIHLKNIPNTLEENQWDLLIEKTRGFSGMNIVQMIKQIYKEKNKQLELNDFLQRLELSHFKPSVSDEEIEQYIVWMQNFGTN